MLSGEREGLFELGQQLQQQGEYQAALHCFLSCLLGLTHVQSFTSLPNCLHQIAELFITEKNYGKALQFIQAEKMFYEVALIELTALHGSTGLQEEPSLGSAGRATPEELSEQASQAQHLERLAHLCIMSKQPHLALEYSGKAAQIHQRAFGNDHPITARSLEFMATVYAEIGKTEYSAYETTPSRPHLVLFACIFLMMSFVGIAMYCTDRRRPQRVCEQLEAALAVYLLHMKQLVWGCWIWLTMQ
ncbi:nutritionally-regulated adipose and cardiac enriched protein homolog isoform X2 [Phycodurus eques]|uniref:nutritionally-regulated adipose and cardiac enriched protein homolog isoform X2 n=1 Tax=Phycodurus eques TaxID=693459 RepID=UPI002ACE53BB|nr:nutritionally-regulated adipose and cardiac enriched protein homolog isoform X2 [Phycodurus eques]